MSRLRSNRLLARASRWLLLQDVTSHYVPRLTPEVLLRAGLSSGTKVLDLTVPRVRTERRAVISIKWRG